MDNLQKYQDEINRSQEILKRNRHNCISGDWYGPDPEPQPAGPSCQCSGCYIRYNT